MKYTTRIGSLSEFAKQFLTDKNHIINVQYEYPTSYDRVLYNIYKETGVFQHQYLDKLYQFEPIIVDELSFPQKGVRNLITSWSDPRINPEEDIVIYSEKENWPEGKFYWEPFIEFLLRKQVYEYIIDYLKVLIPLTITDGREFELVERRLKNYSKVSWGYIEGRKSHFGPIPSGGHIAASIFNGYELWIDYSFDCKIIELKK